MGNINTSKLPKPSFNFFHGELSLVKDTYVLKNKISGWWLTMSFLDMDVSSTLQPGIEVTVWYAKKSDTYFVCKHNDMYGHKDVLFVAEVDSEDFKKYNKNL